MSEKSRLPKPIWWAILATIIMSIGGEILANLACGQITDHVSRLLFSSIMFILSGTGFFYTTYLVQYILDEYSKTTKEKEQKFLWSIHNPNINLQMVINDYKDVAKNDEIEQWRRERIIVLPDKIYNWLIMKSIDEIKNQSQRKLQWSEVLGFVLLFIGIAFLFWPNIAHFFFNFYRIIQL